MCESMCVGSLRMTFVPVEVPKVVPKQRIKPRHLRTFNRGDRLYCVAEGGLCLTYGSDPYVVVTGETRDNQDTYHRVLRHGHVLQGYDCQFVLESETIIEDGVRVVGYVNDPCGPATVAPPKTLKFNDLPNWCVFTSSDTRGYDNMQFLKISYNTVVRWDDGSIESSRKHGGIPAHAFTNGSSYDRGIRIDHSWGIYNNLADCTIIGNIKFG